jgi:hypothetical protein
LRSSSSRIRTGKWPTIPIPVTTSAPIRSSSPRQKTRGPVRPAFPAIR